MAQRNLLQKSKLEDFKVWLDQYSIDHRAGRGEWQALQVQLPGDNKWHVIFYRIDMSEHFTVSSALVKIVRQFIDHQKITESGVLVIGPNINRFKHPAFWMVHNGVDGNKAVRMRWNDEHQSFYDDEVPTERFYSHELARENAINLARQDGLPIKIDIDMNRKI